MTKTLQMLSQVKRTISSLLFKEQIKEVQKPEQASELKAEELGVED